ncbi:hypothetical protein QAD02_001131 [Eretmocerus hayati]|uniref:Uncharacterized protein n=1 Tax=Eretmocerus hayati TaxID=131215 RepID=A0ACC2NFD4_9HYME|nr:hypothetical protein QAD02_001131 [Eretmocerus hayati]
MKKKERKKNEKKSGMVVGRQSFMHEFLPLCDVLFNIISLASYFCDIVFDLAMAYALAHYPRAPPSLFPISVVLVVSSLVISQIVSVRWYLWGARGKLRNNGNSNCDNEEKKKTLDWTSTSVLLLHGSQIGVLWRYFKLFIPVDLTYVKHEVRELCILRLIHGFCEAGPMLLLQVYLLAITNSGISSFGAVGFRNNPGSIQDENNDGEPILLAEDAKLSELTAVSAGLSLWSVCWAVASFSKGAARLRNLERLVLTWLGVLAQLVWRLGTVSARVGALVAYASVYGGQWLVIVVALHWLSMLTWLLLTPDGLFRSDEQLKPARKFAVASMLAFVYVFSYVNLHETNHRQKMLIFYSVMFLENSLLMGVWAVGVSQSEIHGHARPASLIFTLLALFFGGLCFMGLYYRYFHVRRLRYEAGGRMNGASAITTLSHQGTLQEKYWNGYDDKYQNAIGMRKTKLTNSGIPGVFNCRFANPAVTNPNRKKKKPTTFVPPPTQPHIITSALGDANKWSNGNNNGPNLIPFWKRPISIASLNNDDDTSTRDKTDVDSNGGSRNIDLIHEKLREKKQQQLRELRAIQEEIKEGKLVPPPSASTPQYSNSLSASNQQPPPNTKLHSSPPSSTIYDRGESVTSWPPVKMHCLLPPPPSSVYYPPMHGASTWTNVPNKPIENQEILLAPRCLPYHYSHWSPPMMASHRLCNNQNSMKNISKEESQDDEDISDLEGSQLSLPRSYTLPREFKYPNKLHDRRDGRVTCSRLYQPSTNSSDGDVDSADNEEETDSELRVRPRLNIQPADVVPYHDPYTFDHSRQAILNNDTQTSLACGTMRDNQYNRTRIKPETRL